MSFHCNLPWCLISITDNIFINVKALKLVTYKLSIKSITNLNRSHKRYIDTNKKTSTSIQEGRWSRIVNIQIHRKFYSNNLDFDKQFLTGLEQFFTRRLRNVFRR